MSGRRSARGAAHAAAGLALLLLLPALALAQTIAAIGGGLSPDNAPLWQRLVNEAGGPGARFVVFATASELPQLRGEQAVQLLRIHGASAELIPMAPAWPGLDAQAVRDDPAQIARVAAANAVFFTGGSQGRIVDLLQPGGEPTPLLQAIRAVLARGGLVAGTSAGAAILSREMFRDAPHVLDVLAGQLRQGREIDRGLSLVPDDLFIDQHVLKRGRLGRMLPMMQRAGFPLGLGVADNSAVLIHPDGDLEVLGEAGALLVDLREARRDPALPGFNLQGVRLSYLEAGDRYRRGDDSIAAAPHKTAYELARAGLDALRGQDLLVEGALLSAMATLVESAQPALLAQSCSSEGSGFEFRLAIDGASRAWRAGRDGSTRYTLSGLLIAVRPLAPEAAGHWLGCALRPAVSSPAPGWSPRHISSSAARGRHRRCAS